MPNKLFFSRPTGQPQLGHHDSCHKSLKLKPIETKKRKERKRERKRKKYTISNEFIFISQNLSSIFKFLNSPSAPNPFHRPLIRGRKKEIKIEARCGARNKPATLLILIVTQNQNICSARQTLRGEGRGEGLDFVLNYPAKFPRLANCWKFHRFNDGQKGGSGRAKDSKAKRAHFSNRSSLLHRCEGWSMVFRAKYDRINLCNRIDRSTNGVEEGSWIYSASLRIFHRILFHFFRGGNNFYFFFFFS